MFYYQFCQLLLQSQPPFFSERSAGLSATDIALISLIVTVIIMLSGILMTWRKNAIRQDRLYQEHTIMRDQLKTITGSQSAIDYAKMKYQVNGLARNVIRIEKDAEHCQQEQTRRSQEIFAQLRQIDQNLLKLREDIYVGNKNR
jgi:hypothetical protein